MTSTTPAPAPAARQPFGWAATFGIALCGLILQAALLYHDAFLIKPAGDDSDLIAYVAEGRAHGFAWFFLHQKTAAYFRPAKHCVTWLLGSMIETHRDVAYRSLHFATYAVYLLALALWLGWIALPRRATLVAIAVFLVHPGLVATLSSIDGFGGITSMAMTWLGVWLAIRFVARPAVAIPAVVAAFAVGCVFKEYVLALLPLAAIATWWFADAARWRRSLTMAVVLGVEFAGYMLWRHATMPRDRDGGFSFVTHSPLTFAVNGALATVGVLYPGDTIPVALTRSAMSIAMLGTLTLLAVASLGRGLWLTWHVDPSTRRRVAFLLFATAAATFPCILHTQHFAEKYVAPMLLPFALLAAYAAEGLWRAEARPLRPVWATIAALLFVTSGAADLHKNREMRDVGERATRMVSQIAALGVNVRGGGRLLVAFVSPQLAGQKGYSVYCMSDDVLLGTGKYTLEWWFPRSQTEVVVVDVGSTDDVDAARRTAGADRAVVWDVATQTFSLPPA